MWSLKRFAGLARADQILLLQAVFLTSIIRVVLDLFPFWVIRRIAVGTPGKSKTQRAMSRIVWAVPTVSRYIPRSTCLTRALATQALLSRSGYESRIELGVAKNEQCRFEAHAWVMCGDQIVIGGPEINRYTALTAWPIRR